MRKIAHIINPFIVEPSSDLHLAQPITFETMRRARDFAAGGVAVSLYSAQFPEDRACVPDDFCATPDLTRSILDFGAFPKKRKLPLLADILDRLYEASDADYLIFTNVDIAVMPHFYAAVNTIIDNGCDAFAINRRTIELKRARLDQLPLMYAEVGAPHEGHDCFVFRRDVYPKYRLGAICTGLWYIGRVLLWNLACHAKKFKEHKGRHLTFHLGNDRAFVNEENFPFFAHNKKEAEKIQAELRREVNSGYIDELFARYPILDYEMMRKRA